MYKIDVKTEMLYACCPQDMWTKDLEVRLEKFLTLALKSTPQPRLFDLYVSFNTGTHSVDTIRSLTRI